ncbi:MAG TPA: HIT family protein [archaeon]|nr:HIT family protein [archaeon]
MNLQIDDCIFCKIIGGKLSSKKIYEDDYSLAFLDIYPTSKGHCLVIPKNHYATILEIPEFELAKLIRSVQKIGAASMKALRADGFNVLQNNKPAAGQVVNHLHFHIIPRFSGDGLKISAASRKAEEHELAEWESALKGHL